MWRHYKSNVSTRIFTLTALKALGRLTQKLSSSGRRQLSRSRRQRRAFETQHQKHRPDRSGWSEQLTWLPQLHRRPQRDL